MSNDIDLLTAKRGNVMYWGVGLEIKSGEKDSQGVYEERKVFDADSENEALLKAQEIYSEMDWGITRLRYIKRVYENENAE